MPEIDFLKIGLRHLADFDQERLRLYEEHRVSWDYFRAVKIHISDQYADNSIKDWLPVYTSLSHGAAIRPDNEELYFTLKCIGLEFMGLHGRV